MTKYYIGYSEDRKFWEPFGSDDPTEATPESSGYDKVEGPFDTPSEAKEAAEANN